MADQNSVSLIPQPNAPMVDAMLKNAPDGIVHTDLQRKIIYCNHAFAQIFGYDNVAQLKGKDFLQLVDENERQQLEDEIFPRLEQINGWRDIIFEQHQDDGTVAYLSSSGFLILDEQGASEGIGMIIRDVTESYEKQILVQQVIDSLPGIMVVKDRKGVFKVANRRIAEIHGMTPNELVGKTEVDIASSTPEQEAEFLRSDLEAMDNKKPVVISEETVIGVSGEPRYFQMMKVPLIDEDGLANHVMVIATDIHDRKMAEEENIRLREEMLAVQSQTLKELSTPIIPLMAKVLVMPLIGSIDAARSRDIMRNLLAGISEHRAKTVIVDITGVPAIDADVVDHLNKTIQAARLKGARTIVTGISDAVAETIVDLGIDWGEVETLRDLQSGLRLAMEQSNLSLKTR